MTCRASTCKSFKFNPQLILQEKWGLNEAMEDEEMTRRQEFAEKLIPSSRSQLRVLRQSYQVRYCLVLKRTTRYCN